MKRGSNLVLGGGLDTGYEDSNMNIILVILVPRSKAAPLNASGCAALYSAVLSPHQLPWTCMANIPNALQCLASKGL